MEQDDALILVYTTLPDENAARKLGGELVQERLAACVNIFPGVFSIYRWQGNVEKAGEAVMIVKTRKSLQAGVLSAITERHPYSTPALLVIDPVHVASPYLSWALSETRGREG